MTRTEMLLTILAEECSEVAQVTSLAQDFGLTTIDVESAESTREDKRMPTDYRSRIALEIEDLFAAVEMLQKDGDIPDFVINSTELTKNTMLFIMPETIAITKQRNNYEIDGKHHHTHD